MGRSRRTPLEPPPGHFDGDRGPRAAPRATLDGPRLAQRFAPRNRRHLRRAGRSPPALGSRGPRPICLGIQQTPRRGCPQVGVGRPNRAFARDPRRDPRRVRAAGRRRPGRRGRRLEDSAASRQLRHGRPTPDRTGLGTTAARVAGPEPRTPPASLATCLRAASRPHPQSVPGRGRRLRTPLTRRYTAATAWWA